MKITVKFISAITLCIIIVLAIDSYFSVGRELEFFHKDMKLDTTLMGDAMKGLVSNAWHTSGQQRALELIHNSNKQEHLMKIRWVWLDASQEELFRPKVPREKLSSLTYGQEASFKVYDNQGNELLCTYFPLEVESGRRGALEISESLAKLNGFIYGSIIMTIVLTVILILMSILVLWLLGIRMLGRPLNRLMEKVQRVGVGDFSGPLHLKGNHELTKLATTLNAMCEQLKDAMEEVRLEAEARIKVTEQLRHEDRLRTVGRLASGIAHELGTPLNVISGRAGMIARGDMSTSEIVDNASTIKGQAERITTIIRQLLDFARRGTLKKTSTDLQRLVGRTLNLMAPLAHKQKIDLCFLDEDAATSVNIASEQIQQVLMNIITNALQAMPQGGKIEVGVRRRRTHPPEGHEGSEGQYFCIYIKDQGQGISKEDMEHIFEPFFTTKDTGKGTGLGLSIAYGIVREHGGWIDVNSEIGKGSCFSIYLPQEDH